jgi:DNA modification methylase
MKLNGKILVGDGKKKLNEIPDESVQCVITSPPYWKLREYGDGEKEQLGLEDTPQEYVKNLVNYFKGVKRVLRKDGTFFLNIADRYRGKDKVNKVKELDLVGIPWMVAFALRDDGWYLRSSIIWDKMGSTQPTPQKNRPTINHEDIFLLTKEKKYYYDIYADMNIKKSFLRTVWYMNRSYTGSKMGHYGTFPVELPQRCIKLGTSEKGCCSKCASPYKRKLKIIKAKRGTKQKELKSRGIGVHKESTQYTSNAATNYRETIGWDQNCECTNVKAVPCTVLDPFFGSGTTGEAAERLGRKWIGIELYKKNCDEAMNRIKAFIVGADYIKLEKREAIKKVGFGLSRRI